MPPASPTVLLYVNDTLSIAARSGVQRVVVKLARQLAGLCRLELVRWEAQEGRLRFCDRADFDTLFGPCGWPEGLKPRLDARALRRRFGDMIDDPASTWLVLPEIPYHTPAGLQPFTTAVSQVREYGVRVAAVLYDLIPVLNAHYADHLARHLRYLAELVRADLVLPISAHAGGALARFMADEGLPGPPARNVLLAESEEAAVARAPGGRERHIVMVGTVEPRKRQLDVMAAYAQARLQSPAVSALPLVVVGAMHPAVTETFQALLAQTPGVSYRDYLPDAELEALWRDAAFSVFASDDEGYGLPVAESLARGVPCLAADVAPITEIAGGRGVLHVDVRSRDALAAGLVELAERPERREALRREAASAPLRTWGDYARDVLAALGEAPAQYAEAAARPVAVAPRGAPLADSAAADVVTATDEERDALVAAAGAADVAELLPHRFSVDPAEATAELDTFRRRLSGIARVERAYGAAWRALSPRWAQRSTLLRIVVSTYNRRPFVVANVRWLLDKVVSGRRDLELVVVDNASTDGTAEALAEFAGEPVRVIVNPANVGMLGNMRVCSQLPGAEYVWLIGDDDFIVPAQVDALIAALKGPAAGVPLAYMNFAVYHREALGPGDTPERLQAERIELAPRAIKSGIVPVRVAAAQHDNLFTAIYINVWRSDVLAAAYDHPFEGRPFGDLVESIPCTKTILESYAEAPCWWNGPVSIVGNAHNSWSRHRPRWHGLLMPQALHLARDAGVDPRVLGAWAEHQGRLYDEAREIAREAQRPLGMDDKDYALSWPTFRRRIAGEAAA
ncbi:MAG: glycosyltransferase [Caulobacteraceae bacterium]|nr:glycosyltransferase [Caulobacter sp.]